MYNRLKYKTILVLGITGQLSTGKSTVAAMFVELGAAAINADLIAHHGMRPGGACYAKIVKAFGPKILCESLIDRRALASIVFANPKKLKQLESIVHPFVIRETKAQIQVFKKAGKKVVVVDAPLLFEAGMDKLVDLTAVVKVKTRTQMARSLKQGRLTVPEAKARIRHQWPLAEKIRRADLIIDNEAALSKTKQHVKEIWDMIHKRYF